MSESAAERPFTVSVAEAAKELNVGTKRVYGLIKSREIAILPGQGHQRVLTESLEAYKARALAQVPVPRQSA